jgi:predicted HTH domain antitoxin
MPLTITDEQLKAMGMDEREARVELACRSFDADRLSFHDAARMAGLDRLAFESALRGRGIAIYRPTVEDLRREVDALKRAGA